MEDRHPLIKQKDGCLVCLVDTLTPRIFPPKYVFWVIVVLSVVGLMATFILCYLFIEIIILSRSG